MIENRYVSKEKDKLIGQERMINTMMKYIDLVKPTLNLQGYKSANQKLVV